MLETYVIANGIIIMGYLMLSVLVAPVTDFTKSYTRYGAIIFFLTCALHHFHNVTHSVEDTYYRSISVGTSHVVIDCIQAVAVWVFILGMTQEQRFRKIPMKVDRVEPPLKPGEPG